MLVGIWKIKGDWLKCLGILMMFMLDGGESQNAQIIRTLYFFGALYLTLFVEGQRSLRRKRLEDWEDDDV